MKIKVDNFEKMAERRGYIAGVYLYEKAGGTKYSYEFAKNNYRIGYEIVKELYNILGERDLNEVIIWEDETINGLRSKYFELDHVLF